jgi:predicted anti-sigma-YlaC factor YlaD
MLPAMTRGSVFKCIAAAALAFAMAGCSPQRFVVDRMGDALAGDSRTVAREDDPELVRAAAPFSLELMESLLDKDPDHPGLLLAATSEYTQFAYAFVQLDADLLEDQDYAAAARGRLRARRLYLRARDHGLHALDVAHPGFRAKLRQDAPAAVPVLRRADVPLLYWTAVAWAGAISQAKDDPNLVGDLPLVDLLVASAERLDPDFGAGALQSFLISYEMARGGRTEVARSHFERAVTLSGGHAAAPYVALAEQVSVAGRARAEYLQLLSRALAIDADRFPDNRLENLVLQRRARWLQDRVDDLFLPTADAVQPEDKP